MMAAIAERLLAEHAPRTVGSLGSVAHAASGPVRLQRGIMSEFTQAERSIRVVSVLDQDELLFSSFAGTEGLSRPFSYRVDLYSEDPEIAAADLLRTPLRIEVDLPEGGIRYIHGLVRSFTQLGQREDLTAYRAEIVPWTWFLSISQECRIHQEKSVLEIIKTVFDDLGLSDFDDRCSRSYPKREYCVQYRESHLNFVSRLMEEEGIFYFFEHGEDAHTLVLADGNTAFDPVKGHAEVRMWNKGVRFEDGVTELEREHAAHPGRVTLKDYDYLQPTLTLRSELEGDSPEEVYDYHPRRYTTLDRGDRYARVLLEGHESRREVVYGRARCRHFESGKTFELLDHYRDDANQEYALLQVSHAGRVGDFWARQAGSEVDYDVNFVAVPKSVPFRPPRIAVKPTVKGPQTAEVVGKQGEEIWTDEHGRIKVQFHWDREGQRDEHSSCWVRVASPWAGKSWGKIHLPRIGQEVVVEFLEGDPDHPLVTGSVYNVEQPPPYPLPADQTKSGMKSRSSKGGGGYNEISIDDKKGSEAVTIHAQKDMSTTVLHDDTQTVRNDRSITVDGIHTETIKKNTTIRITEGDHVHDVVAGKAEHHVKKDMIENYDANQVTAVGKEITITAGDKITIKTGQSSIVLQKDGKITIIGKNVAIEGTKDVKIDAPKVAVSGGKEAKLGVSNQQITCDTTKVGVSGAAINSSAVGMHEIAGAVVKIN
jgi:type VI secretion system secreted protein VgrG